MRKVKTLALSLCFMLIFSAAFHSVSGLLERKVSTERFSEFLEDPEEFDVWFMGSSHMFYAVQPMELWKQYGIRSFNLASAGSNLIQVYWTMMCALQYSQPELIVVDTYKVQLNEKKSDKDRIIHNGLDRIPLSAEKIKGVYDIFDTWEERFEYLCPFSVYHNRWENLTKNDFVVPELKMKGGKLLGKAVDYSDFQIIAKEDMSGTDTRGFDYLEKIIEECQKRGIELILTEIPFCSTPEQQRGMNAVPDFAKEHGVVCLNMAYEEDLVDYGMDFGDKAHVNLFGAKKLTGYIGDYLLEHCDLTDYRETEGVKERWNADYESFLQNKDRSMRSAKKLVSYLQWIGDDRYTCYLYQSKEFSGLAAKEIARLDNIVSISLEEAKERIGGEIEGEYAFIIENEKGEILDTAVFKNGKKI